MKERGVDLLKPYTRLSREAYFALADEARRQGIPVAGHVPLAVRATEASDAGQRSVEHFWGLKEECSEREDELRPRLEAELGERGSLDHYLSLLDSFSEERCGAVAARFVENGTWHVPTLVALEMYERIGDAGWLDDPRLRYVAAEEQEYWRSNLKQAADLWSGGLGATAAMNRRFREIVALMRAAGAGVMAGSDVGDPFVFPGFSLHEELELLVAAGLTPAEALRAATLSPAEYLEATDSHGAVAPGKLADLLLLDANPLEDIRNTQRIHAVVFDGRYFDRQALDDVLAGAEAAASRSGTVQVGSPTGVRDADRSIPAALKQVRSPAISGPSRPLRQPDVARLFGATKHQSLRRARETRMGDRVARAVRVEDCHGVAHRPFRGGIEALCPEAVESVEARHAVDGGPVREPLAQLAGDGGPRALGRRRFTAEWGDPLPRRHLQERDPTPIGRKVATGKPAGA
jgi:hypothetical protein